jgi:hypothetical protein
MAKQLSVYQQRKAEGKCVRLGCDEKPPKNSKGERRSYCLTHNAANRKNSDAWVERQGKAPKKAKRAKAKKQAAAPVTIAEKAPTVPDTAPTPVEVTPRPVVKPGVAAMKMTEAEVKLFNERIADRMQRTGCSRKIAAQWVRRQPAA